MNSRVESEITEILGKHADWLSEKPVTPDSLNTVINEFIGIFTSLEQFRTAVIGAYFSPVPQMIDFEFNEFIYGVSYSKKNDNEQRLLVSINNVNGDSNSDDVEEFSIDTYRGYGNQDSRVEYQRVAPIGKQSIEMVGLEALEQINRIKDNLLTLNK